MTRSASFTWIRRLALAALFAAVLAPRTASAEAPSQVRLRRFALLVGVNDGGAGRPRLRYAVTDARAMARVLQSLGGVAPGDILFLADPDRASVLAAFDRAQALVRAGATPGVRRELVVYYSGHSDEEGLLIQGERVSYDDLRARLQSVPADVRVAILDSCSSGAFTRRKGGVHRPPFLMDASVDMRGHAILTSSSANEVAQESDRVGGSFFTHFLVSGLRGAADVNSDRRVTLQEAFQFASAETLARTERTRGGPQHAAYEFDLAGTGELVVTDVRSTQAALVLAPDLAGRISVRDASGDLVAELRKASGHPVELGLEPGPYVITMDGQTAVFEAHMTLVSGERTPLSKLAFHPAGPLEVAVARGGAPAAPQVTATAAPPVATGPLPRVGVHSSVAGVEPVRLDVHGISFGIVTERVHRVTGLQLALGLVQTDESMVGFQTSLGAAISRGYTKGVQAGTIASFADGQFRGVQLSDVASITRGDAQGLQMSGAVNFAAGSFTGLELAPVNVAEHFTGLQLGAVNAAGESTGVQLSAVNVAKKTTGFQLGAVNVAVDESAGFQLAAINVARRMRGFQFGAVNVIGDAEGEAFGVITWATNGIHSAAVYTSDTMLTNLAVKLGTRHLYTAFSAGFNPGSDIAGTGPDHFERNTRRVGYGFGLGWRFPVEMGRLETLDLEASGMNLYQTWHFAGDRPIVSSLRLAGALRLAPHLALYGGPGINVAVGYKGQDADVGLVNLQHVETSGATTVRIYPGFVLGVQI